MWFHARVQSSTCTTNKKYLRESIMTVLTPILGMRLVCLVFATHDIFSYFIFILIPIFSNRLHLIIVALSFIPVTVKYYSLILLFAFIQSPLICFDGDLLVSSHSLFLQKNYHFCIDFTRHEGIFWLSCDSYPG